MYQNPFQTQLLVNTYFAELYTPPKLLYNSPKACFFLPKGITYIIQGETIHFYFV